MGYFRQKQLSQKNNGAPLLGLPKSILMISITSVDYNSYNSNDNILKTK